MSRSHSRYVPTALNLLQARELTESNGDYYQKDSHKNIVCITSIIP